MNAFLYIINNLQKPFVKKKQFTISLNQRLFKIKLVDFL